MCSTPQTNGKYNFNGARIYRRRYSFCRIQTVFMPRNFISTPRRDATLITPKEPTGGIIILLAGACDRANAPKLTCISLINCARFLCCVRPCCCCSARSLRCARASVLSLAAGAHARVVTVIENNFKCVRVYTLRFHCVRLGNYAFRTCVCVRACAVVF